MLQINVIIPFLGNDIYFDLQIDTFSNFTCVIYDTKTSYTFTDNYDFLLFECADYSLNWGNTAITYSGKGTFVLLDHTIYRVSGGGDDKNYYVGLGVLFNASVGDRITFSANNNWVACTYKFFEKK